MDSKNTQRQLRFNAETLTEMYKRYGELRRERKKWNGMADVCLLATKVALTPSTFLDSAEKYQQQAAIFTPEIKRLRKRIASVEQIQKALKHELACVACLEAWQKEDDAEWLQRAEMAREEGFVWSGTGEEFLASFPVAFVEE